jgi:hypothetical protein
MKVTVEINVDRSDNKPLSKREYMIYVLFCLIAKYLRLDKDVKQINL